tara:strand:- start:2992 stop:7782 length:4791 start_codon:yes stop_codon:yes gene_type:complete
MPRNIRTNYLTDKSTFGNSTMPIGSVVPIFKATDDKVTDNGVVENLGAVASLTSGGTGYTTDLGTVTGYPTIPIQLDIPTTVLNFGVGDDNITITNHPFIEGDKLTVIDTDQGGNLLTLGASIQSFTIGGGGGSNYTSAPLVQVTDNGSGPTKAGTFGAEIDLATGKVTGINVIDGGAGYQFPQVTFIGGGGSGATATATLALNGVGGIKVESGFSFLVDVVDANTIKWSRSNGDIAAGKYYNITQVGDTGTLKVASSTGFGLTVGISALQSGEVDFATIKNPGYGYSDGDVVYITQPGSSGDARVEIVTTASDTGIDPAMQYPGWLYCDGGEYDADEFPLLYEVIEDKYGGTSGTYKPENFGADSGGIKFNVPDYKARKIVGVGGGVSGSGSPVSGNVISTVGNVGGRWFFSKTQQEALFDIGNIVITGYQNITEFVGGTLTGEVGLQIGPLQEKMISAVPEHEHAILTSTAPQAGAFEGTGYAVDTCLASYKDSVGQVSYFLPAGGVPLFHSHGVVDYILTDPTVSTFGNTGGIGEIVERVITATNIISDPSGTIFNIPGHDLFTGYKIRVKENNQSTPLVFDVDGQFVTFATNTEWYVIKNDDDNFRLATSKYNARKLNALSATTNGSATENIVLEMQYKIAGNLPADQVTVIQQPPDTVYDIDSSYVIGGKTIQLPGGSTVTQEQVIEQTTGGSYTVPAPTQQQLPIAGVTGTLTAAGGGGATSSDDGGDGGDSYYQFNYGGNQYQIFAGGGGGGDSWTQLLQTKDWVAVGTGNISSGAAAVWSTFLLTNGIYPIAPVGSSDPYVGSWVEAGVGINVDASLAAAGFNVEFHCDGLSEMDLWDPNGTYIQGNATPPNTSGPGVPYTSSATLVVPASNLTSTGWYQLKVKVKNDFAVDGNDTWDNNPGGVGFVATRADNGATMFTSRGECTGGTTTTFLPGGGAAGSGGQGRIVSGGSTTNVTSSGNYTVNGLTININNYFSGIDGTDGTVNSAGIGATTAYVVGAGGDGSRTLFTGTTDVSQLFTTPDGDFYTYNLPTGWPLDSLRAEITGGGGGSGGLGDSSGWWPGSGGSGKFLNVNIDIASLGNNSALRVYVGGGGTHPSNVAQSSPRYVAAPLNDTGFASGGASGYGTGGGAGGSGGAASAIGTSVVMIAGAGGGGGGGGAGDNNQASAQNGGFSNNDGAQSLTNVFSGSGGTGFNSVCTGGGGGGGGGGVGGGTGIGGGGGAGNGSNSVRDGFGANRGQSAYKSGGSGPQASLISESNAGNGGTVGLGEMADGGDGRVRFVATQNQTFYGPGGGGGGSGNHMNFQFDATNMNAGTLVVGSGGNNSGESGYGSVNYQVTTTIPGGTGTSTTSGLFDSASVSVDYFESGTGSGVNGGFTSTDAEKYLRFVGNEATRWARSIGINATSANTKQAEILAVKFRVICGNGSNGGEAPGEPLELFASSDNATSFTKIGTISSTVGPTDWTFVSIPLPTAYRVGNLILEIRQERSGAGNADNDNFGIDYVSFEHEEVEQTITTYPSGKTDLGIEFVTERIEPQGDPINSAGFEVNEGTFTLSSAVKLNVSSALQPDIDIPLLTRYHLVKYMIRAY